MNGVSAKIGDSADPDEDVITVDGRAVDREPLEYWVVHKPRGVLTTVSDTHGRQTVLDLVPNAAVRLFPVGRLDRDTEGLVILTNDGVLAHALLHPSHGREREYVVTVRARIEKRTLSRLERGIELDDGLTAPATAGRPAWDSRTRTTMFTLTLTEGRKRQIRRALDALGHPVVHLVRIRMATLTLGKLRIGGARRLTAKERRALLALT